MNLYYVKENKTDNSFSVTEIKDYFFWVALFASQLQFYRSQERYSGFKTAKTREKPGPRGPGLYQHF